MGELPPTAGADVPGVIAVGAYRLRAPSCPDDGRWQVLCPDDRVIGYLDGADGAMRISDEQHRQAFEAAVLAALRSSAAGARVSATGAH